MKLATYALISSVCLCPACGQIAQSHPEYCGIRGGVSPPLLDISATIDQTDGHPVLYLGRGSSATALRLPGYWITGIAEVCPLSDGRLVVFADFGGTDVHIVDRMKSSVVDSFTTYFRRCLGMDDGLFTRSSIHCTEWRQPKSYWTFQALFASGRRAQGGHLALAAQIEFEAAIRTRSRHEQRWPRAREVAQYEFAGFERSGEGAGNHRRLSGSRRKHPRHSGGR